MSFCVPKKKPPRFSGNNKNIFVASDAVRYRLVVFLVENEILRKRRNILPLSYVVKKNTNQAKESYAISAAILMSDLAVIC